MSFTPALESVFQDIFGGQPDNAERLAQYMVRRKLHEHESLRSIGPWILEYEARGETFFTSAVTPEEALARTNDKEPHGWMFNSVMTQDQWFDGVGR